MAFDKNFLQLIGGTERAPQSGYAAGLTNATTPGAPRMWSYKTTDSHATVDTADYFLTARHLLDIGDLIYVVVVNSSGVLQTWGFHCVKDKSTTSVDVTDVLAGTMTDTD